ncbi:MAG: choice-of-anchor J domain-containing protein [Flavobacteriia bacterium]|jgi:hypothetical protein
MRNCIIVVSIFVSFISWTQTDILLTDFQAGIPSNYSIVNNDGLIPDVQVSEYTSAWIVVPDPDNITDSVASSTSFFNPIGTADRWLITPPLSLGAYGNSIEWQGKSKDASYPDDYLVLVSTTDADLTSFTDTIGYIIEENFEWTTRSVNLSSNGYNNQTVYVAFRNITEDGFKLYIDDIHVWVEDPANIEELSAVSITVFPNPVKDVLTIESNSTIEKVLLTDLNGNLLFDSNSSTLDLSKLSTGFYNLHVVTQNGVIFKKVLRY